MRKMFYYLPEVTLFDATHGTDKLGYKLISFMVHDTFGKGQYAQECEGDTQQ